MHQTDLRKAAYVLLGKWEKSNDFLFGFLTVDFVLALRAAAKIFVLKFGCEIRSGFGEIKMYTFGIGYCFQWARLKISKWNRKCVALPFGYNFVAVVALIILLKNAK